MPRSAAAPVATMTAVGVARPIAHGHAMTSTATIRLIEVERSSPAHNKDPANVSVASTTTMGTNTPATRSATFCIRVLPVWASSTQRMIRPIVEARPTRVASTVTNPSRRIDPDNTLSPTVRCFGLDSPVMALSSIEPSPDTTVPSTGTIVSSATRTRSPTTMRSIGTLLTPSSVSSWAVAGKRRASAAIAEDASRLARNSKKRPRLINARIMATA